MPDRSTAGQEQSGDAGWHGTGPECQDTTIHPLDLIFPCCYPSRLKRTYCQLLEVTHPLSFLSHLLGQLARCRQQKRHRLRRQHKVICLVLGSWATPTTWPTSPHPSPKGLSALEEGHVGARQPSQRSRTLGMHGRGLWVMRMPGDCLSPAIGRVFE